MNLIKRCSAFFVAVLMLVAGSVVANAAELDESEKKFITDELFEARWEGGIYNWYYECTKSTVKIEHDPLAAIVYMLTEAEVEVCDSDSLQDFGEGKITRKEFYKINDEFNLEKAKKIDKFKNSLILGYEFSIGNYKYGTWELELEDGNHTKVNAYFKEDSENFTLYEEETNNVLGVYHKLIGYEYLDSSENNTGNDGGSGGSGSASGSGSSSSNVSSNNTASYLYSEDKILTENDSTKTDGSRTNTTSNEGAVEKYDPDTENPSVTPEIVSAVDEMKASAQSEPEDKMIVEEDIPVQSDNSGSTGRVILILVIIVAIVFVIVFLIMKHKK